MLLFFLCFQAVFSVNMVWERQTSDPGEGHSSGELAGVERSAGGQLRPHGQQPFQQIPEHQGGYPSGGRSVYQSGRRGGHTGGRGGRGRSGYQSGRRGGHTGGHGGRGRSGYQSGRRGGRTGGRGGPEFQQNGGNHQQYPRGGATPQPGPSRLQYPYLHQATMLPYQVAPNNSNLQQLMSRLEDGIQFLLTLFLDVYQTLVIVQQLMEKVKEGHVFQQNGGNHLQYPRGGATPQPVPSRPRSSDLHQVKMLPYKVAPNNSKLPFGSPTESLADDSSSQSPQQPQGGRLPFGGPSRLQYPDLHQAISPYQPPYRSASSTSKAPFGSPTKYLGDDSSSQAPQQHPKGDAKPQPRGSEPPYGVSTSLSPDLHQAISPYQPTKLSAPTTSKVPFGCPTKSLGDDSSSQESHLSSANVSQLSSSSQKMVPASSTDMRFPLRPGFGTRGSKYTVTANHFFVQLPDKDLHQYDVTIIPEDTPRGLNRAVIKKLENLYKQSLLGGRLPVYDGRKSLYTAGPLPFDFKDFKITLVDEAGSNQGASGSAGSRKREFTVMIKLVARVDLHHLRMFLQGQITDVPQEAVHALNIALSELPTSMSVQFGRSFFPHAFGRKKHLGEGLESRSGFHQSIRPNQMGISLNIVNMVWERQTSDPGEGHSSGELAGVERGAGGQLRPHGQQPFQQIPEHQGRYPSGGRSGYQSGRRGGHTGGRGGRGRSGYQSGRRGGHTGGRGGPEFQQNGGNHQQYPRGGATPQPGPSRLQYPYLHQATMLPYQVAPNNSNLHQLMSRLEDGIQFLLTLFLDVYQTLVIVQQLMEKVKEGHVFLLKR